MTPDERTLLRQMRTLLLLNYAETKLIMATQQEHAAELAQIRDKISKTSAETSAVLALVESLEAQLAAAGGTSPEVDALVVEIKARLQAQDDKVADAAA